MPEFSFQSENKSDEREEEEEEEEDVVFALTDYSQHSAAEISDRGPQLQTAELLQHQKQVYADMHVIIYHLYYWGRPFCFA